MAYHEIHLIRSGTKSACGRNLLYLSRAMGWEGFKATPRFQRCEKCDASRQAELHAQHDAEKDAT